MHLYLFVFGAVTIAGGVMGFVKAKSRASLIAGSVSGALLLLAGFLASGGLGPSKVTTGAVLGLVVSLALAARFVMTFLRSRKMMPAGLMALLSVIGVVVTALSLKN